MQVDASKFKLNELTSRLIDAMNLFINNYQVNLDKTVNEFYFLSEKLVSSQKHRLETIKKSYLIENPCKMQFDYAESQLNMEYNKLISSVGDICDSNEIRLNDLKNRFKNNSKELIVSGSHELSKIKSSYSIRNPCKIQLDYAKSQLNSSNEKLLSSIGNIHDLNNSEYADLKSRFKSKSNEIILTKTYELNSIKASPVLKNHLNDYIEDNAYELDSLNSRLEKAFGQIIKDSQNSLNIILKRNVIGNPYLMIDKYRTKLDRYEDKLDKINQVNLLELEKQNERKRLIKIIVLIVAVFMIIILLLLFGGI